MALLTPIRQWFVVAALMSLAGCASAVPEAIRKAPDEDVRIATARRAPESVQGKAVRWGGKIAAVRNAKDETTLEIVGRQLNGDGRPRDEDQSEGRFLAKVAGFIDPAVYETGREVSVRGQLEGAVKQDIGEFTYTYPVVRAEQVYLWPPRPLPQRYPDHSDPFYDPFWYDPWSPWGAWSPYWPYRPWYRR